MRKRLVNAVSQLRTALSPFHHVTFLALSIGYLCSYSPVLLRELTIVPFYLFRHWHLWSLLTFWMIECSICAVIFDMALLHVAFRVLEPIWGPKGVYTYFLLVNIAVGMSTCLLLSIAYAFLRVEEWMFFTTAASVRGLSGFNGAVAYTLAHTFPQTIVYKSRHFRLQVRHLPALVGCVYLLLCLVSLYLWGKPHRVQEQYFLMYLTGLFVIWNYFRWQERRAHTSSNQKGGRTITSTWLGSFLRPSGDAEFEELLDVKVHRLAAPVIEGVGALDAERYRQKAIKDLNERLAKTRAASGTRGTQASSVPVEGAYHSVEQANAHTPKHCESTGDLSQMKQEKTEEKKPSSAD